MFQRGRKEEPDLSLDDWIVSCHVVSVEFHVSVLSEQRAEY